MTIRRVAFACVLAAAALSAGCATEPKESQAWEEEWASWKARNDGGTARVIKEDTREVVRDAKTWARYWQGEPPAVDFSKKVVLVATQRFSEHPKERVRVWRMRLDEDTKERYVYVKVAQVGGAYVNEPVYGPAFHYVVAPLFEGGVHWRDIKVVHDADGEVDSFEMVKNWDE